MITVALSNGLRAFVLDEVAKRGVLLLADRLLQRDRKLRDPEHVADLA